jgi:hypothetical protein
MDHKIGEVVLLALLSGFLCGLTLLYDQPIATGVFAALIGGCVGVALRLWRRSQT